MNGSGDTLNLKFFSSDIQGIVLKFYYFGYILLGFMGNKYDKENIFCNQEKLLTYNLDESYRKGGITKIYMYKLDICMKRGVNRRTRNKYYDYTNSFIPRAHSFFSNFPIEKCETVDHFLVMFQ